MSLRISELATTCHVPEQLRNAAGTVDQLARRRFARDLGEHLGPGLARQPAIVRIRRLPMRVIVPASELNEDALSLKWRQEFGRALFTALAYPPGEGPVEVFQAKSVADFVTSAIQDLLDGTAAGKWQYAEFTSFFRLGSTQAALALICEWPRQSMAVLIGLAEQNVLGRLVARFDDPAVEKIFGILAPPADNDTVPVTTVIATARLVLEHPPEKALALRSRAFALTLIVEAQRARRRLPSPWALFHALLVLAVLLNEEFFWPGIPLDSSPGPLVFLQNVSAMLERICTALQKHGLSASLSDARGPALLHPGLEAPRSPQTQGERISSELEELSQLLQVLRVDLALLPPGLEAPRSPQTQGERISSELEELSQLLQVLRVDLKVPPPSVGPSEVRWVTSDWCGLFFLASTLQRLGWIPAWRQLADFQAGGVALPHRRPGAGDRGKV